MLIARSCLGFANVCAVKEPNIRYLTNGEFLPLVLLPCKQLRNQTQEILLIVNPCL